MSKAGQFKTESVYNVSSQHIITNTSKQDNTEIVARLSAIDWDFSDRNSQNKIENIHPYPAKFISEIPNNLLKILPIVPGTLVFDPFCGSGTTLTECQKSGNESVGVDLNPIACLISRVKTSALPDKIDEVTDLVINHANNEKIAIIPSIPNLDHWFQKPIQTAIAALKMAIRSADASYQDILNLSLSSIIVRVSNQESDTRYAAILKKVEKKDVFIAFRQAVTKLSAALSERNYDLITSHIIQSDLLMLTGNELNKPVGLVITSPPYPNAYEYWLYHKYRMWWLDYDPLAVKEKEIGARAHFFKKNHHTAQNFIDQMRGTFDLMGRIMIKGGFAAFIIGRSKIHGEIIDNAKIIEDVASAAGYMTVFRAERCIASHRKSFNLSHANIKSESLIVLQKSRL